MQICVMQAMAQMDLQLFALHLSFCPIEDFNTGLLFTENKLYLKA